MWRGSRNPPGASANPQLNEPDFEDALDEILLAGPAVSFHDSVAEFARWRWYTGSRDDGAHFADGALFPTYAEVALAAEVTATVATVAIDPPPMMLGSVYVRITSGAGGPDRLLLSLGATSGDVRWAVQALPAADGVADGEWLDLSAGPAQLDLSTVSSRVVVITALPVGADDPDGRTDARYPVSLVLQ